MRIGVLAGYRRLPRLWGWLYTATPAPPAPPSSSLAPALDTMPGQSPAFEKQEKRDADRNPRS